MPRLEKYVKFCLSLRLKPFHESHFKAGLRQKELILWPDSLQEIRTPGRKTGGNHWAVESTGLAHTEKHFGVMLRYVLGCV